MILQIYKHLSSSLCLSLSRCVILNVCLHLFDAVEDRLRTCGEQFFPGTEAIADTDTADSERLCSGSVILRIPDQAQLVFPIWLPAMRRPSSSSTSAFVLIEPSSVEPTTSSKYPSRSKCSNILLHAVSGFEDASASR